MIISAYPPQTCFLTKHGWNVNTYGDISTATLAWGGTCQVGLSPFPLASPVVNGGNWLLSPWWDWALVRTRQDQKHPLLFKAPTLPSWHRRHLAYIYIYFIHLPTPNTHPQPALYGHSGTPSYVSHDTAMVTITLCMYDNCCETGFSRLYILCVCVLLHQCYRWLSVLVLVDFPKGLLKYYC